jgi:hypothetical protein
METQYLKMFIEEGVLHCVLKETENLDLDITRTCVEQRLKYIQGKPYPTIFDITLVKQSTKEGRDYLANEGSELVSASAVVGASPMLRMMANFFIMVNRPKIPTRMFADRKSAVEWLSQYRTST